MFDDGYDYYCFNFVSLFEANPSGKGMDASTYCGCIDYIAQKNATPEIDISEADLAENT